LEEIIEWPDNSLNFKCLLPHGMYCFPTHFFTSLHKAYMFIFSVECQVLEPSGTVNIGSLVARYESKFSNFSE